MVFVIKHGVEKLNPLKNSGNYNSITFGKFATFCISGKTLLPTMF